MYIVWADNDNYDNCLFKFWKGKKLLEMLLEVKNKQKEENIFLF